MTPKKVTLLCILVACLLAFALSMVFFAQAPWIQHLEIALIRQIFAELVDDNDMNEISALTNAASAECMNAKAPDKCAEPLIWTTLNFNDKNAHASEEIEEMIIGYGCRDQYLRRARELLSQPDRLTRTQKQDLIMYTDCLNNHLQK